MKLKIALFCLSAAVICATLKSGTFDTMKLVIKNATDKYITFNIVAGYDCTSSTYTLKPNETYTHDGNPCPVGGFHIDVPYHASGNNNMPSNDSWSNSVRNKDKVTRDWGFSYKDTGADNLEFKMNSDYNAPVLWNTGDSNPTTGAKTGWWVYQRD